MPIAKGLALKILGALAVGGTVVGGGIALGRSINKNSGKGEEEKEKEETKDPEVPAVDVNTEDNDPKPPEAPPEEVPVTSEVLKELGLKCIKDSFCTLETGKSLSVKQEDNTRTLTALPEAGQGGKIRIHKSEEGEKNSTFSIEGGDISPTWGSGSTISKLEEFETYEIEEETPAEGAKKYHFKRKTKALDEKLRILGLTESGCTFPTGGNHQESFTSTCELDKNKLKAINFEGKSGDPTMEETAKTSLKITKLKSDHIEFSKYPLGYQFELSGDKDITIPTPSSPSKSIVKKAGVSLEFKIKVTSQANGPRTLSLEKVSQLERLAAKVGFTECKRETKTCKFPRTGLNVYRDNKNSIKGGNITNYADQTITFQEDVSGYEGEIKFTVSSDISISPGTIEGTFSQISAGNYEIKQQSVNDKTDWYLSKKN